MSTIQSPVKSIQDLSFEPFPAKPLNNVRIARKENTIVAVTTTGMIYTNRVSSHSFYLLGDNPFFDEVFVCLGKLKILTDGHIAQHRAQVEKIHNKNKVHYALRDIEEKAADLGIKLTSSQKIRIAHLKAIETTP